MAQKKLTLTEARDEFTSKWTALDGPIWPVTNTTLNKKFYFKTEAQAKEYLESDFDDAFADEAHGLIDSFDVKPAREAVINNPIYNEYALYGSTGNTLKYSFYTAEASGSATYEAVLVTYKIENTSGTTTFQSRYSARANVTLNLDRYLVAGENNITVNVVGQSTKASTTQVFTINMLELSVSSTFSVGELRTYGEEFTIPYIATGSRNMTVEIYIDGILIANPTVTLSESGTEKRLNVKPGDLSDSQKASGRHTLQIRAYISITGMDSPFYSNRIYREFTISGGTENLISIQYDTDDGSTILSGQNTEDALCISAVQYSPTEIIWGLYLPTVTSGVPNVKWRLSSYANSDDDTQRIALRTFPITETENDQKRTLTFTYNTVGLYWLEALVDDVRVARYKINVTENSEISEFSDPWVRLLAEGRDNNELSTERCVWQYNNGSDTVSTEFANVAWNAMSGWDGEALLLAGGAQATVLNAPFKATSSGSPTSRGVTFEIEFMAYNCGDDDVTIIKIGDIINITPTSATISAVKQNASSTPTSLKTNFAKNQKIKLQFIVTPSDITSYTNGRIMFIMANGVLDRMSAYGASEVFTDNTSNIVLGDATGVNSVKIYGVRVYPTYMSYTNGFNNFVVDSPTVSDGTGAKLMANLVSDNKIFDESTSDRTNPNYSLVSTMIPTMLITGDVAKLVEARDKTAGDIIADAAVWTNPWNPSSNWSATKIEFRRHGQSTLNYPVPSLKFWLAKDGAETKVFDANDTQINKGRWAMKDGNMPMKKYILQAYYVDSSCCKSPALLQILNDAYLACNVNGNYVLRTPPQHYALEQYPAAMAALYGGTSADYVFPYTIRTTPDSLPCAVFWRDSEDGDIQFLGQMVLMDDKKSDYVYGQRSIYPKMVGSTLDPFDFLSGKSGDALWDNSDIVRFEMLINTGTHALMRGGGSDSYFWKEASAQMLYYKFSDGAFLEVDDATLIASAISTSYASKEEMETARAAGTFEPVDGSVYSITSSEVGTDSSGSAKYEFENTFEMIYPDYDDIHGTDEAKYKASCAPLQTLLKWLDVCYADYQSTGTYNKLYKTIDQHIDLYFLAAYYKVLMDNGLVDNVARNSQLITYGFDIDGNRAKTSGNPEIWYWLFWDLDTAYGVLNNGALAFGPRITRNTSDKNGYAFASHDSFLWNAMEAWKSNVTADSGTTWNFSTVLQNVVNGMNSVYNYSNLRDRQESVFCDKWPEQMYNCSEWYKYGSQYFGDRQSKAGYLAYMQGRGELYRRWWMSVNMTYWNARICAGDYTLTNVAIRPNENSRSQAAGESPFTIKITFGEDNYFGWAIMGAGVQESGIEVSDGTVVEVKRWGYQLSGGYQLYAMSSAKKIDLSDIAQDINEMALAAFYDDVNGSMLTELNMGVPKDRMITKDKQGYYIRNNANSSISGWTNLTSIQVLNIQGWATLSTQLNGTIDFSMLTLLTDFYAAGAQLGSDLRLPEGLTNFYAEFPSTIAALSLTDITFRTMEDDAHSFVFIDEETMEECTCPYTLYTLSLKGMGTDPEVKRVVLDWLHNIRDAVEAGLTAWTNYQLTLSALHWEDVSYDDLVLLGNITTLRKINVNSYIKLASTITAEQVTTLRGLFGKNVFVANNGTLMIDSPSTFVLSADGDDVFSRTVGDETQICLYEGNGCTLSGLAFPLVDGSQPVPTFYIQGGSITDATSAKLTAVLTSAGAFTTTEQGTDDYEFPVEAGARVNGSYAIGNITIHVLKRTYPESVAIVRSDGNTISQDADGRYIINQTGHYLFQPQYRDGDGNALTSFNGSFRDSDPTAWTFQDDDNLAVSRDTSHEDTDASLDQLCVWVQQVTDVENVHTLDFSAYFKDIKTSKNPRMAQQLTIVAYKIITELLVSQSGLGGNVALYNYLLELGYVPAREATDTVYGYFSSDNIRLVGHDTALKFTVTADSGVTSFTTSIFPDTYNILNYLTSCLQLVLDGSHIQQLDFSHMTWLTDLSMQNCTDYVGSDELADDYGKANIDVTACADIVTINVSGSSVVDVNGLTDKSSLVSLHLSSPKSLHLTNCPSLNITE